MPECTATKHGGTKWYRRAYGCICMRYDEARIIRAMRGERVRLNCYERLAVVDKLTAQGLSQAEIADRVRIPKRSVCRIRSRARQMAAA